MNKNNIKIYIILFIVVILIITMIIYFFNKKIANKGYNKDEKELSTEELKSIEGYLNDVSNNGFLLSEYDNASEIDLHQVLYAGAGIDSEITDIERVEYNIINDKKEDYMNITCIPEKRIIEYYKEKTGEELDDITKRLEKWTYLSKNKKYCYKHSDTNYAKVECISGNKVDNIYTVEVDLKGSIINHCKTVLEKRDDKYIFKSNKIEL